MKMHPASRRVHRHSQLYQSSVPAPVLPNPLLFYTCLAHGVWSAVLLLPVVPECRQAVAGNMGRRATPQRN
jgi:hypothetical protein